MKKLLTVFAALALTGCASFNPMQYIPSFWDDNQSQKIIDVRLSVERLQCDQPHFAQVDRIQADLRWLELYSQAKGSRQTDVLKLIKPIKETVDDFHKRAKEGNSSMAYCQLKKTIMGKEVNRAASAILGRF